MMMTGVESSVSGTNSTQYTQSDDNAQTFHFRCYSREDRDCLHHRKIFSNGGCVYKKTIVTRKLENTLPVATLAAEIDIVLGDG